MLSYFTYELLKQNNRCRVNTTLLAIWWLKSQSRNEYPIHIPWYPGMR